MDKEKIKKEIGKMLDHMQEGSEGMREKYDYVMDEAKSKAMETRRSADKYIRENPERSVLVSAGIGAVVGIFVSMLLKGKSRCRHFRD